MNEKYRESAGLWDYIKGDTAVYNNNLLNTKYADFNTKWDGMFTPESMTDEQKLVYNTELTQLNDQAIKTADKLGGFDSLRGDIDSYAKTNKTANEQGQYGLTAGLGDAMTALNLYQGFDNLFGSGKDARDLAMENMKQQMAHNNESLAMLRSDRKDFKDNKAKITSSYMGNS